MIWVESTSEGNCINDTRDTPGNDTQPYYFYIQGDLAQDANRHPLGVANSDVTKGTTILDYHKNFNGKEELQKQGITDLKFIQQEDGGQGSMYTNILKVGNDYDVATFDASFIGDYKATITGKTYYEGSLDCDVIVKADLGNLEYMQYSYPQEFRLTSGQAIDFTKQIKVTCDGTMLEYDKDYTFDQTPADLQTNIDKGIYAFPITIKPKDGVNYLGNKYTINCIIKTDIEDAVIKFGSFGANEIPRYEYAHGNEVFNPRTEIKVTVSGRELKQGTDYQLVYHDNENNDALINCGTKTIEIQGITDFSGSILKQFIIYKYDIGKERDDKEVRVKNSGRVTYNGSTVYPDVSVEVLKNGSWTPIVNSEGSESGGDYIIESGSGDNTNWTHDEGNKPTFIVTGNGRNYTGQITGNEYVIDRRDISDENVKFKEIIDQNYNNGREIRIVPEATYNGRNLVGVTYDEYESSADPSADTSKHFAYEYVTKDLVNVGTKQIRIHGMGNFTGTKEFVTYKVVALKLGDTELIFDSNEPVIYDGHPQTPAFRLIYGSDTILEFTGKQLVSNFIKNADYVFDNNINAGTATIRVFVDGSVENTNYTGEITKSFTILPASLSGHTKFMYRPMNEEGNVDLSTYTLNYPFDYENHKLIRPEYAVADADGNLPELPMGKVGIYFDYSGKHNHGDFLIVAKDYETEIEYKYVLPDSEDEDVREEDYPDPKYGYAGKVKVTIKGTGNYTDSASFWYFIGKDISAMANISMNPTTNVYNSQPQYPTVKVSGVNQGEYKIARYKNEIALDNIIGEKDFVNAGTYYIRIEGSPADGTYSTKPHTLTYTITPRPISNSVVIDGYKKEYPYTGYEIRPVGISVTDYIDRVKYRLTEDLDYTLSYSNNLNAGTAFINVECKNNFSGTARANFLITSSTISSGSSTTPNTPINGGTGEISGSKAISPNDVILTMDTANAMHYTGNPVYPKVSIAGMTENVDYTVTFSNNTEVGTATVTITGIGNNRGTITKTFNIIAPLSNCKIAEIPAQQYTGSAVEPTLTVTCGKNILIPGTDYNVTYANNINIGTATATIRAASNSKYTGSASVTFSIANDVGDFIISGYAPTYTYTGNAITPSVVVETGSGRLTQGTDYTISYSNNINAGKATITVKGVGRYSGTKTATFIIEAKSIQGCTTTEVEDRTYTGDAYTPTITVTDGNKVLTSGVDYTVTYTNNTEPGTASILIQGMSNNYSGTKVVNFKIGAVAVKGLKATKVKYNSLKLKWTKQGYADGYQICDAQSKVVKNVTKNSVTLKKLATGKTYRYKVRSYIRNADGTRSYGAFSSVVSATTKLKTPEVEIVSKKTGQARITWSKVSGANGYEIYYKKSSGETYRKVKTVNNANVRLCRVRGMKSGDKAYFRVRAFKKTGSKKVYSSMNKLKVITVK